MEDYTSKQQKGILQHISDTVDAKVSHLVVNRQMTNDEVHWSRGYIAAYQALAHFISDELNKKLNEE